MTTGHGMRLRDLSRRGVRAAIVTAASVLAACDKGGPPDDSPAGAAVEEPGGTVNPASPAGDPADPGAPVLEGGEASLPELLNTVLSALHAQDAETLSRLRITEREYKEILWPEFPENRPGNTIPVDFHWGLLDTSSRKGLLRALQDYGGVRYELLEFVPTREEEVFPSFRFLKGELRVRRVRDGREGRLDCLGSVVVVGDRYKLLSYRD